MEARSYQVDNNTRRKIPDNSRRVNGFHAGDKQVENCCVEKGSAWRFVSHYIGVESRAFEHSNRRERPHAFIAVYEVVTNVEDSEQEVEEKQSGKRQH